MQSHPFQQQNLLNPSQIPNTTTTTNSSVEHVSHTVDASESKLNPFTEAFDPIKNLQASSKEQLFTDLQNILTESQNVKYYIDNVVQPNLNQINQVIAVYQLPANQLLLLNSAPHQLQYHTLVQQQIVRQQELLSSQLRYQQLQQDLTVKQRLYQQLKDESYSFVPHANEQQFDHDTTPDQTNTDNNTDAADTIYTAESVDVEEEKKHFAHSLAETSAASIVPPSVSSEEDHIDEEEQEEEEEHEDEEEEDVPFEDEPEENEHDEEADEHEYEYEEEEEEEEEEPEPQRAAQENESVQEADESEFESEQQSEITQSTTSTTNVLQHEVDEDDEEDEADHEEEVEVEEESAYLETADVSSVSYGESVRYKVMDLLGYQSQCLSIDWSDYTDIPLELRFDSRGINNEEYMSNVVAMFTRRTEDPWKPVSHTGVPPKDKKEILTRKLRGILNKMTPEKFDKVAAGTMNIVNQFAESKERLQTIIGIILSFAILIPAFSDQYAKLCQHLFAHLPRIGMVCEFEWILKDHDLSKTFRQMIIVQTNKLFETYRKYQDDDDKQEEEQQDAEEAEIRRKKKKTNFFAVLELVAELFNVDLIHENVVYLGVLDALLPPKNTDLTAVDIEGLCRLFKRCGKKLDQKHGKLLDGYLQKMTKQAKQFDFRTRVLAEDVQEMRANDWTHRIKKQKAMTLDEVKEQFDEQQQKKQNNSSRRPYMTSSRSYQQNAYHDVAEDESYNIGYNDANPSFMASPSTSTRRYARGSRRDHRSYRRATRRYNEEDNVSIHSHSRASSVHSHHSSVHSSMYNDAQSEAQITRTSSRKRLNENEYDNGESQEQIQWKLNGYIDEYLASGVIDDILEYNCTDLRVWRKVINDSLRDRKSSEIDYFIELISALFEHKQLHNKGGVFVHIVVKYLAMQLDDACVDCPNMMRYVCRLFARLCHDKHFSVGLLYGSFTKRYRELSQHQNKAQKKQINKMLKYSQDELYNLGASQVVISKLDRYYL